ncbi:1-deoxy-D-xylulose-5-phosphate reductoisomerase [Bacteroidota bacterium]
MKKIAILGSTGSIGSQALEVIQNQQDNFQVEVITANNNVELLIKQAIQHVPNVVVIGNENKYKELKKGLQHLPIKIYAGSDAISQIVEMDNIDIVITAMVGFSGLLPTINAIKSGKNIALANKETLVVAGEIISKLAKENGVNIYPVDSEHSAIFQCMAGEWNNPIEKIILTASGGPFLNFSHEELKIVTIEQALNHPNWCMGNKITIDSATLMNKGLEAIEAKWLFDLKPEQIEIIIHTQSIIHSMVQFEDGSIKAQMGLPDMKLPILYALSYPERLKSNFKRFSFLDYPNLTFEQPNYNKFRNLALAFESMKKGGNMPCALNAANEIAVESFLNDEISFIQISDIIENTINKISFAKNLSLDDYIKTDQESREIAKSLIK